jgi:hypothetical protein
VRSGSENCIEDVRRLIERGGGNTSGDENSGSSHDGDECGFEGVGRDRDSCKTGGLLGCSVFERLGGEGGSASDSM